jgi:hypothetical protein
MSMSQVNLMHIILLGPSMIYIGSLDDNKLSDLDNKTIDLVFNAITTYSLFISFIVRRQFMNKSMSEWSSRNWINFIHYIIFIGLFYYIGSKKRTISQNWRYIALYLGISIISIHLYLLLIKYNIKKN